MSAPANTAEKAKHTPGPWVRLNHMTQCYEARDGTRVSAELCDHVECLADVFFIASIRAEQRAAIAKATGATP